MEVGFEFFQGFALREIVCSRPETRRKGGSHVVGPKRVRAHYEPSKAWAEDAVPIAGRELWRTAVPKRKRSQRRTSQAGKLVYPTFMPTLSVKEQVLHAVQRLPDDADFRDVSEEIALLAAVAEAEEDIRTGQLVDHDAMKTRVEKWLNG